LVGPVEGDDIIDEAGTGGGRRSRCHSSLSSDGGEDERTMGAEGEREGGAGKEVKAVFFSVATKTALPVFRRVVGREMAETWLAHAEGSTGEVTPMLEAVVETGGRRRQAVGAVVGVTDLGTVRRGVLDGWVIVPIS